MLLFTVVVNEEADFSSKYEKLAFLYFTDYV